MSIALYIEAKIVVYPLGRTTNPRKSAKGHNFQTLNGLLTGQSEVTIPTNPVLVTGMLA